MSTAQQTGNKATVRRLHDATNTGDTEFISNTIDELVEPDALIRTPLPLQTTGAEALKEVFARLHQVFPDLRVAIEDLIEEGDKVVSRNTVTGTHRGDYMGHPPTGKPVTYNEIQTEVDGSRNPLVGILVRFAVTPHGNWGPRRRVGEIPHEAGWLVRR